MHEITLHVRAAHHGQLDCTFRLSGGSGPIGTLDFSEFGGHPQIQMIRVAPDHQRQGHAFRLLAALQARYPDQEIDWGSLTSDGAALKKACPVRQVPTEEAPAFARLSRLRRRLGDMERRIAALSAAGRCIRAAATPYYCLQAHIDTLEWILEEKSPTRTLLDLGQAPSRNSGLARVPASCHPAPKETIHDHITEA